jgi:hypothetical protein
LDTVGPRVVRGLAGRAAVAWGVAAALAAGLSAAWMWGFTVDDALIAVRYARHLAAGEGYRFNIGGAVTDGVTPLPWVFLLVPLANGDALDALARAKVLGLVAWLAAAGAWGVAAGRAQAPVWAKRAAVATVALSVPVAAYAVSGMETPIATALATCAATAYRRPRLSAALAGLASALRPEMLPWAIVLGAGLPLCQAANPACHHESRSDEGPRKLRDAIIGAALSAAPFILCAFARLAAFGHAAPLSVQAKPSDLSHGIAYAGAAAVVSLAPLLACAPFALWRAPRAALVLAAAGAAHFLAIAAAGGDWMPYARLAAPVVPSLALAFVLSAAHGHALVTAARALAVVALGVYLLATGTAAGRGVSRDRAALIASARPLLTPARSIASLDVGWPTAASEATLVDLAGLTDPAIAALPGGHTSKHIDPALLLSRDPDVVLLYAAASPPDLARWDEARYTRSLEKWLARSELIARHFEARAFLPLGSTGAGYVVLTREE